MQILEATDTPVIAQTKELCQTLAAQPSFQALKSQIDAFMADEGAKNLYQKLNDLRTQLTEKQRMGMPLTDEEVNNFETGRDELLANDVANGFIEAQQGLQKLQEQITAWVGLTVELGRVPSDAEVEEATTQTGGCCGGGGGGGGGCCGG